MGAITISRAGLTGRHTVDDAKITNVMRLFGERRVPDFADMTAQQKADAVAQKLYEIARAIAWDKRQDELKEERATADQAELDQL